MKHLLSIMSLTVAMGFSLAQTPVQQPKPNADPYANNADAGKTVFPLAAPAGKDSGAITKPLPGGVNQGAIAESKWKYGPAYNPLAEAKI